MRAFVQRFWKYVIRTDGCWQWTASVSRSSVPRDSHRESGGHDSQGKTSPRRSTWQCQVDRGRGARNPFIRQDELSVGQGIRREFHIGIENQVAASMDACGGFMTRIVQEKFEYRYPDANSSAENQQSWVSDKSARAKKNLPGFGRRRPGLSVHQ